jgi:hypothetical protein
MAFLLDSFSRPPLGIVLAIALAPVWTAGCSGRASRWHASSADLDTQPTAMMRAPLNQTPRGDTVLEERGLPAGPAFGLTSVVVWPPERPAVRPGGTPVPRDGWRLEVRCDQGKGSLLRVDTDSSFQGDGVFRNWSQQKLAQAYAKFIEPTRALDGDIQFPQLD